MCIYEPAGALTVVTSFSADSCSLMTFTTKGDTPAVEACSTVIGTASSVCLLASEDTHRSDELQRGELQLADVLDEEGGYADGGGVQHCGVGEVVCGEQLGEQRDALVRVRVQLADGASGPAGASRRVSRAPSSPFPPVDYTRIQKAKGYFKMKMGD